MNFKLAVSSLATATATATVAAVAAVAALLAACTPPAGSTLPGVVEAELVRVAAPAAGRLVARPVQRATQPAKLGYAWRTPVADAPGAARKPQLGLALRWWLAQLESPTTRTALLERHGFAPLAGL